MFTGKFAENKDYGLKHIQKDRAHYSPVFYKQYAFLCSYSMTLTVSLPSKAIGVLSNVPGDFPAVQQRQLP